MVVCVAFHGDNGYAALAVAKGDPRRGARAARHAPDADPALTSPAPL